MLFPRIRSDGYDWRIHLPRWFEIVVWLSVPLGLLLLVLGILLKNEFLVSSSLGLLSVSVIPGLLILAGGIVFMVGLAMAGVFWMGQESARKRRLAQEFEKLENQIATGDASALETAARLVALKPSDDPRIHQLLTRLDNPLAIRRTLLELAGMGTLETVSLKMEDPLAPYAWFRKLELQDRGALYWTNTQTAVSVDSDAERIQSLWKRAITAEKPFSIPPEMGRSLV